MEPIRPLLALALIFFQLQVGRTQTPASALADRIRAEVQNLPIGGKLTVNLTDDSEYYGNLKSIDPDSFTIREVDLRTDVTLRYEDVKRVRKDYGRRGFGGRRVHPRTNLIAGVAILGGLLVLLIVALAADKS